jgi:hypothetical protein
MKNRNLLASLFLCLISPVFNFAQTLSNSAFAITAETKGNFCWNAVREIDLSTGAVIRNIYIPSIDNVQPLDATTGKIIVPPAPKAGSAVVISSPAVIAAAAYDSKNNRLYFTQIQDTRLGYFDLNSSTPKIYYVEDQLLKAFPVLPGEDDNITRMTFAADGNGYALTNNGEHLIKFTTGSKINITDLGALKDDIANVDNSVHKAHDSWGGDMIGDAFGNLYLITVSGSVFKINTQTLTAKYSGNIKGLPENYTVNAAAVDAMGSVVVSSALDITNYFRLDLATLQATAITKTDDNVYNASDFANGNLAYQKEVKNITVPKTLISQSISIYPNPVQNKVFNITYSGLSKSKQTIEITTLSGKNVYSKTVDGTVNIQPITLPYSVVPGVYIVKIISDENAVYTDKIVVE